MSDPRVASACRTVAAFGTYRRDTMSESGMGPQDPKMTGPDEDPLRKLPPVPPEDAHLHVMGDYREALDNTLAKLLLLDMCEGRDAPECATIIDYPLHEFPRPDPA